MSETVREIIVKPICSEPLSAASSGDIAFFDVTADVFDHDDGVVDDETGGDGERHERKVVERVAAEVHHAKSADDGERHGQGGNYGSAKAAQEKENDHDHQRDGEHRA